MTAQRARAEQGEQVILVDRTDRELGTADKLWAHESGALHRAFSVFVINPRGEVLLQRRAAAKYHSGGLWSNTCCGHPRPGEETSAAARRRLQEEMGIDCDLVTLFAFEYRADVGDGLIEHEYDHVFIGRFEGEPKPDPGEVAAWRWETPADTLRQMAADPAQYTHWFRLALARVARRRVA